MNDISSTILKMVEFGVDHAIASIKTGEVLVPFIVIDNQGSPELHRFVDKRQKASVRGAIKFIKTRKDVSGIIVLAYDGNVKIGNRKNEAILLKAGDPKIDKWHLFAQAYERSRKGINFLAKIAYLGLTELEEGVN